MNSRLALIFLLINLSLALKCQVCENDGVCTNDADNGVETECAPEDVCGYFHEVGGEKEVTMRKCSKKPGAIECEEIQIELEHNNVTLEACYCESDLCNKDQGCTCGLKCQTCLGEDGACLEPNENGISDYCLTGQSCAYVHQDLDNGVSVSRRCEDAKGQTCVDISEEGHDGYICYCNEPNCNKDEQCTCNNNPALQCQVCQLEDHMCDGESDNGKSETCLEGEVCVMLEESYDGDMRYYRMCEKHDKPNDCEIFNEDVSSTKKCYCDTDNCNKDDDCKSCDNQNPGIKCQVCNGADGVCDNVEDMGESKECQSGEVCAFVINEYEGRTTYTRSCHQDVGQTCVEEAEEGLHAYMCFCNEDNCNTQRECVCGGEGGLKCQVCGGEANDGMCEDQNDNGDSKTCPEGTVCAYFKDVIEGQTVYHRQCDTDPGQQCLIDQELNSVHCFCNTDNCNADQQCNCEVEENRVCQVCDGAEGACQDQNDNGEAQTCAQGQVCGYFLEDYFNEITYIRKCVDNPSGETCITDNQEGLYSVRCYCNEDKCNEGDKCHCDAPPPPTFPTSAKPSTTQPPNGLKCQVCTGDDGICSSLEDLGESQTCLEGEVCAFMIAEEGGRILYARNCAEDINQDCLVDHPEEGVTVTRCSCNTDNCNTMQECECKTSTIEPDHGLKCQVCSEDENGGCFNLEDLGESKTCAEGEICSFFIIEDEGRVMYERKCFESTNEDCLLEYPEEGVTVTGCFCDTDNCNTIQECHCQASSTTQVPTTSTTDAASGLTLSLFIFVISMLIRIF